MAYNGWKLIDKVTVAIKTSPDRSYYGRTFNGFVVDASDKKALESAKSWAREEEYDYENRKYTGKTHEPGIHTFENGGFGIEILKSAGGSSQGGRLSFLACEVEKDGIKFVIGVNDELLVDLIRNSDIHDGKVTQKVMFVRKGGKPGFIHEGMDAYKEAVADMKQKANLKSAKKTNKWEIGGVYSTITQTDICLGEVWDTMEEYREKSTNYYWNRDVTKLRKAETPKKVIAWMCLYGYEDKKPESFAEILKDKLKDRDYVYFDAGKPPARSESDKYEVKESDLKLIDKLLSIKREDCYGATEDIKARYVRELK